MAQQNYDFDSLNQVYGNQQDQKPAGIFSMLSSPVTQGILATGLGALASRGTTAQAIGRGGLLGLSAFGQAQDQQNNQLLQMAQAKARQDALNQLTPDQNGVVNASPGTLYAAGFTDPSKWADIRNAGRDKVKEYADTRNPDGSISRTGFTDYGNTIDTGRASAKELSNINGQAVDMWNTQPGQVLPQDVNKPMMYDQNGNPVANTAYQNYELNKARSGATRVSTSTVVNNKTGESLASQIGPMMKDSQTAADAAVKQYQAANDIDSALNSNNMISGPGANAKLTATQWANSLGFGGKDYTERLKNTRQAVQGLAQLTLQGRQQMRGQGAITDQESALAERAISGDITLTPVEMKVLTNSARRAAEYSYNEHKRKVDVISNNPDYAPMAPFYSVPNLPQAPQSQQSGWSFERVE